MQTRCCSSFPEYEVFCEPLRSAQLVPSLGVGDAVVFGNRVTFKRDDGGRQVSELSAKTKRMPAFSWAKLSGISFWDEIEVLSIAE
jgi:hypothetical protein